MEAQILRRPHLAKYLGVSLRQTYNMEEADPDFPRKIVFSPRCVGWRRDAIDRYLASKERAAQGNEA